MLRRTREACVEANKEHRIHPVGLTWLLSLGWLAGIALSPRDPNDLEQWAAVGASWRTAVWAGEWWRLFTSSFPQTRDLWAIAGLVFGFLWAQSFERENGARKLALMFFTSSVVGAATDVVATNTVFVGNAAGTWGIAAALFVSRRLDLGSWQAAMSLPRARADAVVVGLSVLALPFFDGAMAPTLAAAVTGALLPLAWTGSRVVKGVVAVAVLMCVLAALRPIPLLHDDAVLLARVDAATRSGRWAEVLEAASSDDPTIRWHRINALLELGRVDEAERALGSNAVASKTDLVARVQYARGDVDAAIATLRDAPDAGIHEADLRLWLQVYGDRLLDAEQELRSRIEQNPRDVTARRYLVDALLMTEQFEPALTLAEESDRLFPGQFVESRLAALANLGRRTDAHALLEETQLSPESRHAWRCHLALSSSAAAAREACKGLEGDAGPWAAELRATVAVLDGDCPQAQKLLTPPFSRWEQQLRIVCALRRGDTAEAEALLTGSRDDVSTRLLRFALDFHRHDGGVPTSDLTRVEVERSSLLLLLAPEVRAVIIPE